jgi:HAMP domain-containing protein
MPPYMAQSQSIKLLVESAASPAPPDLPHPPAPKGSWALGLQGKLVAAFMLLLMMGLEADGFLYASEAHQRLVELLGEQARQIAHGLSLASEQAIASGKEASLKTIGQDLLRTRNVLFVVFYDPQYQPISIANRDPAYRPSGSGSAQVRPAALMQVHQSSSPLLGDYVEVWAPIVQGSPLSQKIPPADGSAGGQKLLGYVAVGISQTPEQAQLSRINILAGGIAAIVVLITLPLIFVIVHRIFLPIRQLVAATDKIAAGSYNMQVDVDRSDVIGTLARSFNQMV